MWHSASDVSFRIQETSHAHISCVSVQQLHPLKGVFFRLIVSQRRDVGCINFQIVKFSNFKSLFNAADKSLIQLVDPSQP